MVTLVVMVMVVTSPLGLVLGELDTLADSDADGEVLGLALGEGEDDGEVEGECDGELDADAEGLCDGECEGDDEALGKVFQRLDEVRVPLKPFAEESAVVVPLPSSKL